MYNLIIGCGTLQNSPSFVISEVLKHTLPLLAVVMLMTASASAQGPNVLPWLQQIGNGWTVEAKKALPDLLVDYPNDPSVMFLHASLVDDPHRAMPLYERIVESFPSSEWADDAMLRMTIYASSMHDTLKARKSLTTFRDRFSRSELLPIAADIVRMCVGLPTAVERVTASKPAVAKDTAAKTQMYMLQVGLYDSRANAVKAVAAYTSKRMRARVTEKTVDGAKRYVILVGEYVTEDAASKDVKAITSICKCKPFVVKP